MYEKNFFKDKKSSYYVTECPIVPPPRGFPSLV